LLDLTRFQCHIGEALECLRRFSGRGWELQVQLWRLTWNYQSTGSTGTGYGILTHLDPSYLPDILYVESDTIGGAMEPDRPRSASCVGRGCFTRIPDSVLRELLLVTEFFDGQARVFEGGIAQSETELESWSDLFLVRKVSMGCEKRMVDPGDARHQTNDSR